MSPDQPRTSAIVRAASDTDVAQDEAEGAGYEAGSLAEGTGMVGLLIATAVLVLVVAALSRSRAAATAKTGRTRTRPDANATAALMAKLAALDHQRSEIQAKLPELTQYYPEAAVRGVSHELDTAELALTLRGTHLPAATPPRLPQHAN